MSKLTLGSHPFLLGFEQLERLVERTAKSGNEGYPPFNIEQTSETGYRITLAVAGFREEDLAITVEDRQLVIRGRQAEDGADRVFLHRAKRFDEPHGPDITRRICALTPGHYTRLGAAIRHVSARLADEGSSNRLLIVLTDGKPNDLDHYEGLHGIEDSHMAVREARRQGQSVHGIVIDQDGQDWFARIFGRGGFSLLPDPARLTRALPDIYRNLTIGDIA